MGLGVEQLVISADLSRAAPAGQAKHVSLGGFCCSFKTASCACVSQGEMAWLLHSGLSRNGQGEIATCGISWALSTSLELCTCSPRRREFFVYMESALRVGRFFDPPALLTSFCLCLHRHSLLLVSQGPAVYHVHISHLLFSSHLALSNEGK